MYRNSQQGNVAIIILVTALIAAVGFGAFYYGKSSSVSKNTKEASGYAYQITPTPSVSETMSWKTHTLPFMTLELPTQWKLYSEGNPTIFVNYDVDSNGGGHFDNVADNGKLKIDIYRSESGHELQQYVDLQKNQTIEIRGDDNGWTETKTTISGLPAVKVKTSTPGFVIYTQGPISEKVISLGFNLDFDNYQDLANQILATIKLTQ